MFGSFSLLPKASHRPNFNFPVKYITNYKPLNSPLRMIYYRPCLSETVGHKYLEFLLIKKVSTEIYIQKLMHLIFYKEQKINDECNTRWNVSCYIHRAQVGTWPGALPCASIFFFFLSLFLNPPSLSPVCCVSKPWHLYLVVLCYSVLLRLNLAFLVYLFYNLFYSSYLSYLIVIIVNSFMNQCRSLLFTTLVYLSEFFCYFILNCTFILIFIMCGILGLSGIDTI